MPLTPLPSRIKPLPSWQWGLIFSSGLVYTWYYYQEMLAGPLRVSEDVVQHYLWLFVEHFDLQWKDTFYADASAAIQPAGFYWLLKIVGQVVDPLTISRAGPFFISLLLLGFGVGLLRRYMHLLLAVAGSLLAIHLGFHSTVGFLARSFFLPLLLAFGYVLLGRERPWGIAAVALCSALFYPPVLLLNGGIFCLWKLGELISWGSERWRGRRMQTNDKTAAWETFPLRYWYIYLLGFGLALVVVLPHAHRVAEHPALGGYLTRTEMLSWPEFKAGGRVGIQHSVKSDAAALFRYLLPASFASPFGHWFSRFILVLAAALALWHRRYLIRLGGWLLALTLAALALFFVARSNFPLLFLPDRYVVYPARIWSPLVLTLIAAGLWRFYPKAWLAGVLSVGLLAYGHYRMPADKLPVDNEEGRELIFAAVSALPEDALLAAPPGLASQMPVFTHRNVFISVESAHALYFKHYNAYVMPRFTDYIEAYTTTGDSLQKVVNFLDKWDIDYLMVDREQLRRGWTRAFEPHQGVFRKKHKSTDAETFTLLNLPDSVGVLIQDRLQLVSREELRRMVLQ